MPRITRLLGALTISASLVLVGSVAVADSANGTVVVEDGFCSYTDSAGYYTGPRPEVTNRTVLRYKTDTWTAVCKRKDATNTTGKALHFGPYSWGPDAVPCFAGLIRPDGSHWVLMPYEWHETLSARGRMTLVCQGEGGLPPAQP